jgi:hypothetical protein
MIIATYKNSPSSTSFEVQQETEKAVKIKNLDISSKHAFPVWVPKSQIKKMVIEVPACGDMPAVTFERLYFKAGLVRLLQKPWQRVALGFSCY